MPKQYTTLPIIYIEDDPDDQQLVQKALSSSAITNPVHFFNTGQEVLHYLRTTQEQPLVILCDVKMSPMDGFDLRDQIDSDEFLKLKAIPFVFFSTWANKELINKAYKGNIQGYHRKGVDFASLKEELALIVAYWTSCLHPNTF